MALVMLMNMLIALITNRYQQVEDNAFHKWSYRKTVTIITYSKYHPVPVPFNIITLSFLLLWYLCETICCTKCCKCPVGIGSQGSFDEKIIELESKYYSKYGNDFPISGLDHVVKRTDENHHLIGCIAERSFTCGSNSIEAVGSDITQEWDVKGISILGNRFSYDSCECHQCRNSKSDLHGARYRAPLSPEMPGFEILIANSSSYNPDLILGIVNEDFDLHKVPGTHGTNTVGYMVQNNIIHDVSTQSNNNNSGESEPTILMEINRGDLLGCEILYGRQEQSNYLPVLFTLNGKVIKEGKLEKSNLDTESFYAYVGFRSQEISLLFKQRISKYVPHGSVESRGPVDQSSAVMLKQVQDQISELKKELKEEIIQAIRSEMKNSGEKRDIHSV